MARERVYQSNAERQAAYRARKAGAGGSSLSVILPADVAAGLDAYMEREHMDRAGRDRSQVIVDLLRSQLLRKR